MKDTEEDLSQKKENLIHGLEDSVFLYIDSSVCSISTNWTVFLREAFVSLCIC